MNSFKQFCLLYLKSERNLQLFTLNTLSVSLCESAHFGHLYRKFHNRKWRIQREEAALKFPYWWKTRFAHANARNTRANSLDLETDLNLLTITFHLLTEQSYTSFINSRWKWVILSVRSLTVFKEKIPVTDIELKFVCQTSAVDVVVLVFFFKTCMRFCFLHALYFTGVRLWQIPVKKSVSKFVWKPFKSPFPLHK